MTKCDHVFDAFARVELPLNTGANKGPYGLSVARCAMCGAEAFRVSFHGYLIPQEYALLTSIEFCGNTVNLCNGCSRHKLCEWEEAVFESVASYSPMSGTKITNKKGLFGFIGPEQGSFGKPSSHANTMGGLVGQKALEHVVKKHIVDTGLNEPERIVYQEDLHKLVVKVMDRIQVAVLSEGPSDISIARFGMTVRSMYFLHAVQNALEDLNVGGRFAVIPLDGSEPALTPIAIAVEHPFMVLVGLKELPAGFYHDDYPDNKVFMETFGDHKVLSAILKDINQDAEGENMPGHPEPHLGGKNGSGRKKVCGATLSVIQELGLAEVGKKVYVADIENLIESVMDWASITTGLHATDDELFSAMRSRSMLYAIKEAVLSSGIGGKMVNEADGVKGAVYVLTNKYFHAHFGVKGFSPIVSLHEEAEKAFNNLFTKDYDSNPMASEYLLPQQAGQISGTQSSHGTQNSQYSASEPFSWELLSHIVSGDPEPWSGSGKSDGSVSGTQSIASEWPSIEAKSKPSVKPSIKTSAKPYTPQSMQEFPGGSPAAKPGVKPDTRPDPQEDSNFIEGIIDLFNEDFGEN